MVEWVTIGRARRWLREWRRGPCNNCGDDVWVCENHPDRPWEPTSFARHACGCGAGVPCSACRHVYFPHDDERLNERRRAERALAIEARRAATLGAVYESAGRNGNAQGRD